MDFLKRFLAAILGCLVAFGVLCSMLFIFIALMSGAEDTGIRVKKNSVLALCFTQPIVDYTGKNAADPLANVWGYKTGLDDIIHTIQVAKNDARIRGVSITTGYLQAGMTQVRELRKALLDFKAAGKFIYAYADFYTQKDYYLASVADSLYVHPMGTLDFRGLSAEVLYVKDLQEKSGVQVEVIRHGKYKSAVEPYIANSMSPENRSQLQVLLTTLWETLAKDVSIARNMAVADLNSIADTLGGRTPAYATAVGLIDGPLYFDAYEALLSNTLHAKEDSEINYISFEDYMPLALKKPLYTGKDVVAVVYAQGEILYGEGGKDFIGQGSLTEALQAAADDTRVKAIVLRVNSPGGSALVSDIIWHEVERVKAQKPVVVSLGDVAASGGYYIGVAGDKLFAEPTTITGSIGVFGILPNISQLSTRFGVNAEQVGTHKNAVAYSFFEPMSATSRRVIEESIEDTYNTFLRRVAEGRNITIAEVEAVAQGRVWSGTDALQNGLIDELGSLDDAIAAAAIMANLQEYSLRKYPKHKSTLEQWLEELQGIKRNLGTALVEEELGKEAYQLLKMFKLLTQQEGLQARMPFILSIK